MVEEFTIEEHHPTKVVKGKVVTDIRTRVLTPAEVQELADMGDDRAKLYLLKQKWPTLTNANKIKEAEKALGITKEVAEL